jgi:hypothetical protein
MRQPVSSKAIEPDSGNECSMSGVVLLLGFGVLAMIVGTAVGRSQWGSEPSDG